MRVRPAAPLLAVAAVAFAAGCRTAPHVTDVEGAFARDWRAVTLAVPEPGDLAPWRVTAPADPMARTVAEADAYVARWPARGTEGRAVRAMLATARLLRGDVDGALAAADGLRGGVDDTVPARHQLVRSALHAVGAAESLRARLAVEEFVAGRIEPELFVERWGARVGIRLPPRGSAERDGVILRAADRIARVTFPPDGAGRHAEYAAERTRSELRRMATENLASEAGGLLAALPEPVDGMEAQGDALAVLGCGFLVALGYLSDDLQPPRLMPEQKLWRIEQAIGLYEAARRTAGRFLDAGLRARIDDDVAGWLAREADTRRERFARLYARLHDAELRTIAAIEVR